ncbi:MAG: cold shock domain-containing protein [Immundisolibacteraceae bacterium]|nr:cold shock domain-containing protein [Immundisolibacteraceae bacterium]
MKGTIKRFYFKKGFGFIENEAGEELFFHYSDFDGPKKHLRSDSIVEFTQTEGEKGPCAVDIMVEGYVPGSEPADEPRQPRSTQRQPDKHQSKNRSKNQPNSSAPASTGGSSIMTGLIIGLIIGGAIGFMVAKNMFTGG